MSVETSHSVNSQRVTIETEYCIASVLATPVSGYLLLPARSFRILSCALALLRQNITPWHRAVYRCAAEPIDLPIHDVGCHVGTS